MSRRKRTRKLTEKEAIAALKASIRFLTTTGKADQKTIYNTHRLMDKYKVPSASGDIPERRFTLLQRTQLLLTHLVTLEARLLDAMQENEALEEELDSVECELSALTGEKDDDYGSDDEQ